MKRQPLAVNVTSTQLLSPNLQRVRLQGEQLANFPDDCEGGYIKLMFDEQGNSDLSHLTEQQRPILRTYSIAQFIPSQNSIDVDFVRHETTDLASGFAARWAVNTRVGDTINIAGPSPLIDINPEADWFFAAADMTALPALSAKLKRLPTDAQGYAVIKVIEQQDIREIEAPEKMQLIWLVGDESLADKVTVLPWLPGQVSVWVACEFDAMRALRRYFRNEKGVDKDHIYISSYWKQGLTEDGHKVVKRKDAAETS